MNSGGTPPATIEFDALWDTGATNSVITQNVIDACALAPTGMAQVHGVNGTSQAETYLVNIGLPNMVMFTSMRVTKGQLRGTDVLIGMDIINNGDFAISNHDGKTKFTFRVPSQADIDFVSQKRAPQFSHGGQGKARPSNPRPARSKNKRR